MSTHPMIDPDIAAAVLEYQEEVIQADNERFAQAGWLALSECAPWPDDLADWVSFNRWTAAVNRRAKEIFSRLN